MAKKKIQWKWMLLISIIFFVFLRLIVLETSKNLNTITGESKLPDTLLVYSGSELYDLAENYGAQGRVAYIKFIWTVDFIWQFVYTLFLFLWTVKLLEYITIKRYLRYIYLFPMVSIFFDFIENIGFTIVMSRYPIKPMITLTITPIMTSIKWASILVSALILIYLIIIIIVSKIKDKGNR